MQVEVEIDDDGSVYLIDAVDAGRYVQIDPEENFICLDDRKRFAEELAEAFNRAEAE